MTKTLNIRRIMIIIILYVLLAGWMFYTLYSFSYLREVNPMSEQFGDTLTLSLLLVLCFHIIALLWLFSFSRTTQTMTAFRVLILILGTLSCIIIIGEWAALHDIGDCLKEGRPCIPEWWILFIAFGLHCLFYAFFIFFSTILRWTNTGIPQAGRDKTTFQVVHIVGICCSLVGLAFTICLFFTPASFGMFKFFLIIYLIFILLPYGLALFYWLGKKYNDTLTNGYDEKQQQDLKKAGIFTMLVSLPFMTLFFALKYVLPRNNLGLEMWFPYYIFLVLVGFSGSALYFNRR